MPEMNMHALYKYIILLQNCKRFTLTDSQSWQKKLNDPRQEKRPEEKRPDEGQGSVISLHLPLHDQQSVVPPESLSSCDKQ